jgi:hypothetical protein
MHSGSQLSSDLGGVRHDHRDHDQPHRGADCVEPSRLPTCACQPNWPPFIYEGTAGGIDFNAEGAPCYIDFAYLIDCAVVCHETWKVIPAPSRCSRPKRVGEQRVAQGRATDVGGLQIGVWQGTDAGPDGADRFAALS